MNGDRPRCEINIPEVGIGRGNTVQCYAGYCEYIWAHDSVSEYTQLTTYIFILYYYY